MARFEKGKREERPDRTGCGRGWRVPVHPLLLRHLSDFALPSCLFLQRCWPQWARREASGVPQHPAGLSRNPGMGPGRCSEARQGGVVGKKGGCRVQGRSGVGVTKAGPVQHPPRRLSALGTAGGGAHAHTRCTKPCEPTLRPAAPAAQLPGCTLTLHLHSAQTHGHTGTLRGRRAGPRDPEVHTHVCTHSRTHTQTAGPQRSARRPDTLYTSRSLPLPPVSSRRRLGA